jgi:hypothetical protein
MNRAFRLFAKSSLLYALEISLVIVALAACTSDITSPGGAVPVVQCLLVAGDSLQTAWVEWSVPADSGFGIDPRPVDTEFVRLALVLPDSSTVPFIPAAGVVGRFDAPVIVQPGASYRMIGTVAGFAVSAEVTVPSQLDIRDPAQDTVVVSMSCGILCRLGFRWFAAGATAYLYTQSKGTSLVSAQSTRDTTGTINLLRFRSGPDTTRLSVLALENHAASFLTLKTPKSSITGVFGVFGAATRAQRWIIYQ